MADRGERNARNFVIHRKQFGREKKKKKKKEKKTQLMRKQATITRSDLCGPSSVRGGWIRSQQISGEKEIIKSSREKEEVQKKKKKKKTLNQLFLQNQTSVWRNWLCKNLHI